MPAPTDDEILTALKAGVIAIAGGSQSYTISGRTFTRANLKDLLDAITIYENKIAAASNGSGGFVLGRFGRQI